MADVAVSGALSLVDIVTSFLNKEINLKNDVKTEIEGITIWLRTIQAFLIDKERDQDRSQMVRDQVRQIRDFAYDIEDVIDEFMFSVPQHFHHHRITKKAHDLVHYLKQRDALLELSSKIQVIQKKMERFGASTMIHLRDGGSSSGPSSSSGSRLINNYYYYYPSNQYVEDQDEIIGFQFERLLVQIRNQLLSEEPKRSIEFITGAAGSGKTVLAKKIFQDRWVREAFRFFSFVRVSPSCNLEEVFGSIELQLCGQVGNPMGRRERLRRHFQDKKYLIVLDDVWSRDDRDKILGHLPYGARGSRVIITSCNRDVASNCFPEPGHLHELNALSWKEARNLFCRKAFPEGARECPLDLEEWAEKIVKKCEGLPAAITTVGSLLLEKPPRPSEWSIFHDSMGTDLSVIRSLLPGYNDIRSRSDLKSCFLYLGIFPEDHSIQRERLIRLWIAEGFVKKEGNKSLEEIAEQNLKELINRNLVSVSKRDIDGRVRSCRVLNLVREFIISKAEEENFVWVITGHDSSPSSDKVRRLSIVTADPPLNNNRDLGFPRSAFIFEAANISSFIALFKLLRVLDMKGAQLESFPLEILGFRLLRYLSLQNTQIRSIPSSIDSLAVLETLDLKQTLVMELPHRIFRLQYLRHLLVYCNEMGTPGGVKGVQVGNGIKTLTRIKKLSLIKANSKIIKELGNLVELRKLGIVGLKREHEKLFCEVLQKMPNLSTLDVSTESRDLPVDLDSIPNSPAFKFLQRLYLKGRLVRLPRWLPSLQSLIKVRLHWSRLNSPLEALEKLPNLMELEMVDSYTKDCLEFKADTFRKLKVLTIDQFDQLNTILVHEKAMRELEKLKISKCKKLTMLPLGMEGLSHLKELILCDMNEEILHGIRYDDHDRLAVQHVPVIEWYDRNGNISWSRGNTS